MPHVAQSSSAGRLDPPSVSLLADLARGIVARTRGALVAEFGWTHLEVSIVPIPAQERLDVQGQVLLSHTAARLIADISGALPARWAVRARLDFPAGRGWRALPPGVTTLTRQAPSAATRPERATDLLPADGPVHVVADHAGATLVRAIDGTLGWTTRKLGPVVAAPRAALLPRPDVRRFAHALRSYVGVPYLLGGATRRGIDCSALVQRCLRDSRHAIVPRHSTDQLRAFGGAARLLGEPGDLVFAWSKAASGPHVGVVLRGVRPRQRTIIHASTTSRRVVEEPLDVFVRKADFVSHVELAQILDAPPCVPHP